MSAAGAGPQAIMRREDKVARVLVAALVLAFVFAITPRHSKQPSSCGDGRWGREMLVVSLRQHMS